MLEIVKTCLQFKHMCMFVREIYMFGFRQVKILTLEGRNFEIIN